MLRLKVYFRGETGEFGTEYVNWINTGKIGGVKEKAKVKTETKILDSNIGSPQTMKTSDIDLTKIKKVVKQLGKFNFQSREDMLRTAEDLLEEENIDPKLLPLVISSDSSEVIQSQDEPSGWGRDPFARMEPTEADLVEEQRLLDSLSAIRTWDDVLSEHREGDEAYKHFIDSSYQAIEDSLTKLGEDTEGREMFGRAWDDPGAIDPDYISNVPGRSNYLDAQAFENLTGINPLWKFDK